MWNLVNSKLAQGIFQKLTRSTVKISSPVKAISSFCQPQAASLTGTFSSSGNFLQPWRRDATTSVSECSPGLSQVVPYVPSRGMKVLGRVKRRCKDCRLVWQDGILHNYCKTHPRHKQMAKPNYWPNQRILTCAFQSVKRPW